MSPVEVATGQDNQERKTADNGIADTDSENVSQSTAENARDPRYPLQTEYAPCGFPPEYCEFNSPKELKTCLPWLMERYPAWFESNAAATKSLVAGHQEDTNAASRDGPAEPAIDFSAFSSYLAELKLTTQQETDELPTAKAPAKTSTAKKKGNKPLDVVIYVSKVKGTKQMTAVYGLRAFLDKSVMKDLAKACKKRFSCGATVNQPEGYGETLEIQGDRATEIAAWLRDEYAVPADRIFFASSADLKNKQAAFE
jgi:translation initiation factor 1 (eIF-1/SUI1)